jgi:hypothetical protein
LVVGSAPRGGVRHPNLWYHIGDRQGLWSRDGSERELVYVRLQDMGFVEPIEPLEPAFVAGPAASIV